MENPKIDPLQSVLKAHRDTVKDMQTHNRQKAYTIVLCAVLIVEFILMRLLGA
jgi:hypothetical protein